MTFDIATQLGATVGRRTPTSFDMATRTGAAITGPRRFKACTASWSAAVGSSTRRSGAGEAWPIAVDGRSAHSTPPPSCAARKSASPT